MDKDGDGYLSVEDLSMSSKEAKLKLKRRELQVCSRYVNTPMTYLMALQSDRT